MGANLSLSRCVPSDDLNRHVKFSTQPLRSLARRNADKTIHEISLNAANQDTTLSTFS